MRPLFYAEVIIHETDKKVYVYKVEQFYCNKKNKDARDVSKKLLLSIYVTLLTNL
jgi:hypothetical protein